MEGQSSDLTRRRLLQVAGLLAARAVVSKSVEAVTPMASLLTRLDKASDRSRYICVEEANKLFIEVSTVEGLEEALIDLHDTRSKGDSRSYEIHCRAGTYELKRQLEVQVPCVHPSPDNPSLSRKTRAALVLPDNTSLIGEEKGVHFELPPTEIGIWEHVSSSDAQVTLSGITVTARGEMGNMGLEDSGVKAMVLVTGNDDIDNNRSVIIKDCALHEKTSYVPYTAFDPKMNTDFRSGIIVSNISTCLIENTKVEDCRWDGILGVNAEEFVMKNSEVVRNQPERVDMKGSGIALINRRKDRTAILRITDSLIRNFYKYIGGFEQRIDIVANNVHASQDQAFAYQSFPGWLIGGDLINVDACNVVFEGPMLGCFLINAGDGFKGRFHFLGCQFDINNNPLRSKERGFSFTEQQTRNDGYNVVTAKNSYIRFTHHYGPDSDRLAYVGSKLGGFITGVYDDILPPQSMHGSSGAKAHSIRLE